MIPLTSIQKETGNEPYSRFRLNKLLTRFKKKHDLKQADLHKILLSVENQMTRIMTFDQLLELTENTIKDRLLLHTDYNRLATSLALYRLYRKVPKVFSQAMEELKGVLNEATLNFVLKHREELDLLVDSSKDDLYDYFGLKTLENQNYLIKVGQTKSIYETPQYMILRALCNLFSKESNETLPPLFKDAYKSLANHEISFSSSFYLNSGLKKSNLAPCYLVTIHDDSIEGIFETAKRVAKLAGAGGVGVNVSLVRAKDSYISGINGYSDGVPSMLKTIYNAIALYCNQAKKRKAAIAIYLEPWHADIEEFLNGRDNIGADSVRFRELNLGVWCNDLLIERAQRGEKWTLMCPNECPGLVDAYGDEFKELYTRYELQGKGRKQVDALELLMLISKKLCELGQPYVMFKDQCNRLSNQKHIGTIRGSNLCCEVTEVTSESEVAVCNLSSIPLPKIVDGKDVEDVKVTGTLTPRMIDKLGDKVKMAVTIINKIIDVTDYPIEHARKFNLRHRPIGLGVQGLANMLTLLKIPYDDELTKRINNDIFMWMYYFAMKTSNELAKQLNKTYESYPGSPHSKGLFHFEMWYNSFKDKPKELNYSFEQVERAIQDVHAALAQESMQESKEPIKDIKEPHQYPSPLTGVTGVYPRWGELAVEARKYGFLNSLFMTPMPTLTTSQLLGNNESFEPWTSNIIIRQTLSGAYTLPNKLLMQTLIDLKLWNEQMKDLIIALDGDIQTISIIPQEIRNLFKTRWNITRDWVIELAAGRQPWIDQGQSLNQCGTQLKIRDVANSLIKAKELGLKNGIYYMQGKAAVNAIQFSLNGKKCGALLKELEDTYNKKMCLEYYEPEIKPKVEHKNAVFEDEPTYFKRVVQYITPYVKKIPHVDKIGKFAYKLPCFERVVNRLYDKFLKQPKITIEPPIEIPLCENCSA